MRIRILVILALFVLLACNKQGNEGQTKVSGKIGVFSGDMVYLCYDDPYDFGFANMPTDSAKIGKDGTFSITTALKEPRTLMLKVGQEVIIWNLFLYPNDDLNIDVNNDLVSAVVVTYKGKAAKANDFFRAFKLEFPKGDTYNQMMDTSSPEVWVKYTDERKDKGMKFIDYYFAADSIPIYIRKRLESHVYYQYASARNEFVLNYYYNPDKPKDFKIDTSYWSFLKYLKLEDNDLVGFMGRYLETLTAEWQFKQIDAGKNPDGFERGRMKYELAKRHFWGKSMDVAVSFSIYDVLTSGADPIFLQLAQALIQDFSKFAKDKDYVDALEKLYKKRSAVQPGKDAPDFTLPDIDNKSVSLSSFKGKVVYINFWGTWCAPCLDEMDAYIKLVDSFKDNHDVVFIAIALEYRNMDTWRDYVKHSASIPGIHLYAERQFDNDVCKKYLLTGIPNYMLINRDGKIVSVDTYRPNEKNVTEEIKRQLKPV